MISPLQMLFVPHMRENHRGHNTQTPLSVPELVRCFENDVRDVSSADKVISAIYTEESDNQARLNNACSLSNHRQDVLEATTNLYLTRQVILEHA